VRLKDIERAGFIIFVTAPNNMSNKINEFEIVALVALNRIKPDYCGRIKLEP
jgi:hypothetical protein